MLFGRAIRLWQQLRNNCSSPMRNPNDEGNSLIAVSCICKTRKLSIPGWILGNFSSLRQPSRSKYWRDFNMRLLGRIWSFLQELRSKDSSLNRDPTDWWTLTKFVHPERSNSFKFGVRNLGNFVMDSQHLRLICCKYSNSIPYQ